MPKTSIFKGFTALPSQKLVSLLYRQCLSISISLIIGSYITFQLLSSSFNIMAIYSKILQYLQQQPYTEIRQRCSRKTLQ